MGDGRKSGVLRTSDKGYTPVGKVSYIEIEKKHKHFTEIINSHKISKSSPDTVQIFRVTEGKQQYYAMKDYECGPGELKKVPSIILKTLPGKYKTKPFDMLKPKKSIEDLTWVEQLRLSSVGAR